MNHYDVTIRETLEVKMKVAANSREEAEQFAGTNGNAVRSFWTPAILPAWSSRQNGIPATGATGEFFFRLSRMRKSNIISRKNFCQ